MSNYTVKRIGDMESIFHGGFKLAGAELETTSLGMNVIDMPAAAAGRYPEHTHEHDGQEEVYVVLRGSGHMVVDGDEIPLDAETIVRCAAAAKRNVFPGPDGIRLLVLGGIPGAPYARPEMFSKGAGAAAG